jgi:hypothetical protein
MTFIDFGALNVKMVSADYLEKYLSQSHHNIIFIIEHFHVPIYDKFL